jgi:hypothetical protein
LAESEGKQNFWTTLPGILTGVAALLTAATGLLVIAYPHGFSNQKENPATAVSAPTDAGTQPPVSGANAAPGSFPTPTPAQKGTVLITARDGATNRLFLKTFKHSSWDDTIQLKSGQSISFDKIRAIDFFSVHDYQAEVKVTLTDGRVVDGALATGYSFTGETDIGPFTIRVENLKQIIFNR